MNSTRETQEVPAGHQPKEPQGRNGFYRVPPRAMEREKALPPSSSSRAVFLGTPGLECGLQGWPLLKLVVSPNWTEKQQAGLWRLRQEDILQVQGQPELPRGSLCQKQNHTQKEIDQHLGWAAAGGVGAAEQGTAQAKLPPPGLQRRRLVVQS